jgi:SAM-dependent methyltransferase
VTDRDQDWNDPARVDRWVARDARRPALGTARELAVTIVGLDTRPAMVLELAGGAGTFLATFLDAFPAARGVWSDSSGEMERHARATLSRFGERADYVLADMRDPGVSRASADVVVCARATHVLDSAELNDHMAVADPWGSRYDQPMSRFYDQTQTSSPVGAGKNRGSHTVQAHLAALQASGFTDADTPWRLLSTVLLLARRPILQG